MFGYKEFFCRDRGRCPFILQDGLRGIRLGRMEKDLSRCIHQNRIPDLFIGRYPAGDIVHQVGEVEGREILLCLFRKGLDDVLPPLHQIDLHQFDAGLQPLFHQLLLGSEIEARHQDDEEDPQQRDHKGQLPSDALDGGLLFDFGTGIFRSERICWRFFFSLF